MPTLKRSLLALALLSGCQSPGVQVGDQGSRRQPVNGVSSSERSAGPEAPEGWPSYSDAELQLAFRYPPGWRVRVGNRGLPTVVINVFPAGTERRAELPLLVHIEPDLSFISIFPRGYGTELPSGRSRTLSRSEDVPETRIGLNRRRSRVFLLNDGSLWGFILYPSDPPAAWGEQGFIFAQIGVTDFRAECFAGDTGEALSMDECDPLLGDDFRRHGEVDAGRRAEILATVRSVELGVSSNTAARGRTERSDAVRPQAPFPR